MSKILRWGPSAFEGGLTVTLETAWASHIENTGQTFFMGDRAGATYGPTRIYMDKEGELIDYEPELLTGLLGEFESFHKAIREDDCRHPCPQKRCYLLRKSSMPSTNPPESADLYRSSESAETNPGSLCQVIVTSVARVCSHLCVVGARFPRPTGWQNHP